MKKKEKKRVSGVGTFSEFYNSYFRSDDLQGEEIMIAERREI